MDRPVIFAASALAWLLPLAAQTPAPQLPTLPASANTALTGVIMQRLTDDPVLRGVTITASVGDGDTVSLNGVVPNQALVDRAEQVVQQVPGVSKVTSQILVNVDPFAPARPVPANPPPVDAAVPPPPAATEPQALISDALAKVPTLRRVSVQVYGDRVMLLGSVATKPDSVRAEQIARQVDPHAAIENIIWVNPHPLSPPPFVPKP